MTKKKLPQDFFDEALDAFIDDCFLDGDDICNINAMTCDIRKRRPLFEGSLGIV